MSVGMGMGTGVGGGHVCEHGHERGHGGVIPFEGLPHLVHIKQLN